MEGCSLSQWTEWKWAKGRGTVQCVCVCRGGSWGGGRIFESRAMTAEGEACVRHVCFAFTPLAQLCALSFSQNTGTQQTPSRFALRPTPQPEHRGPMSTFARRPSQFWDIHSTVTITHICWIWAGEYNWMLFGGLRGDLLYWQVVACTPLFLTAQKDSECGSV